MFGSLGIEAKEFASYLIFKCWMRCIWEIPTKWRFLVLAFGGFTINSIAHQLWYGGPLFGGFGRVKCSHNCLVDGLVMY